VQFQYVQVVTIWMQRRNPQTGAFLAIVLVIIIRADMGDAIRAENVDDSGCKGCLSGCAISNNA
jgi:hypothetical protein